MDAANQLPNYACVRSSIEHDPRVTREEANMINEALPLSVALRNDEISEQDFETLYRRAEENQTAGGRPKRVPRRIPVRERQAVQN